jgi:hypothetical protein
MGLKKSIGILLTQIEQQREQTHVKEWEPQSQAEPEQFEQQEQQELEPELPHDIIKDVEIVVNDDPKINVTKSLASKNLSHGFGWNR